MCYFFLHQYRHTRPHSPLLRNMPGDKPYIAGSKNGNAHGKFLDTEIIQLMRYCKIFFSKEKRFSCEKKMVLTEFLLSLLGNLFLLILQNMETTQWIWMDGTFVKWEDAKFILSLMPCIMDQGSLKELDFMKLQRNGYFSITRSYGTFILLCFYPSASNQF